MNQMTPFPEKKCFESADTQSMSSSTSIISLMTLLILAGCGFRQTSGSAGTVLSEESQKNALEPLNWERSAQPERADWSRYTLNVVAEEFENLNQVQDATYFCPGYEVLNRAQKVHFWAQLISVISFYESGWDPTSRMKEASLGADLITGQTVYSEGLLQLSYQDIQWTKGCDFDWSKDKLMDPGDPKRTILDPYKNLQCGIKILSQQIASKKRIILSSGVYWAVIREGSSRISLIKKITEELTFCH